jgi:hypothetical protein
MNQPKFVLVSVQHHKSPDAAQWPDNWKNFLANKPNSVKAIEQKNCTEESVFLIELHNELLTFCEFVVWCKQFQIPVQVQFLEESPVWLKIPPDAKSTD